MELIVRNKESLRNKEFFSKVTSLTINTVLKKETKISIPVRINHPNISIRLYYHNLTKLYNHQEELRML